MREFEIRYNNAALNDPCGVCGKRTDPDIPLAVFVMGTYRPVCESCIEEYAPEMGEALRLFYKAGGGEKFRQRIEARGIELEN